MKTRVSLVSNSSSSSYILVIKEQRPCSSCGREDDILQLVEDSAELDTEITCPNRRTIISDIEAEIKDRELSIEGGYSQRSIMDYGLDKLIKWDQDFISYGLNLLKKIKAADPAFQVVEITISYADRYIKKTMDRMIKEGSIELISETEG